MSARLFCKTGQLAGAQYEIKEEATIGKSSDNTIQLFPGLISGKHARIFFDKKTNNYFLEDLGSRNGTRLDGVRVRIKEKLNALHVITFAEKFDFIFQLITEQTRRQQLNEPPVASPIPNDRKDKPPLDPVPQKKPEVAQSPKTVIEQRGFVQTPLIEPTISQQDSPPKGERTVLGNDFGPIPKIPDVESTAEKGVKQSREEVKTVLEKNVVGIPPTIIQDIKPTVLSPKQPVSPILENQNAKANPTYTLECSNIKGKKISFALKEGENTIGRVSTCDVFIDDNSLSRNHALIIVNAGKVTIKDLGSKNFTMVGDNKVTSEVEIIPGVILMFGTVKTVLKKST